MSEVISKELLSLVLGYRVSELHVEDNNICYWKEDNTYDAVLNLDTLGRLCKKWCLKQDIIDAIDFYIEKESVEFEICGFFEDKTKGYSLHTDNCDTELEAIIKATEWVAKEKGFLVY